MLDRYNRFSLVALALWIVFLSWVLFLMVNMGTRWVDISCRITDSHGHPITNGVLVFSPIDIDLPRETYIITDDAPHYQQFPDTQPRGTWKVHITCDSFGFETFDQVLEVEGDIGEILIVMQPVKDKLATAQ